MQAGKVDLRNLRQRCPHRHKGLACRVAEHCPQRCRSAAASVVCGAASQPHHQPFAAALQRMGHQFTHANDSYFWVVTNFGEMKPEQGYKTQTLCTLLLGLSSMAGVFVLSLIFR